MSLETMVLASETRFDDGQYLLVDAIPGAYEARQVVRSEADALLESRREDGLRLGSETMMPPVDALSTAHSVFETAQMYGPKSLQCLERHAGLVQDCQRLVAEWFRKKKSEYFPPVRHEFDDGSEEFFSHGLSVAQMTYNALVPIVGNREEEQRRVNERVEDATPQILRRLGAIAIGGQSIRTISECTDKAESDYAEDQASGAEHRGYGGYVPEISKYMVRDIWLSEDGARHEEQIALPGRYHTHGIITETLRRLSVDVSKMDKTQLHSSQLLVNDSLMDFAERVDEVASEQWCTNIFMGEEVPADHVKDYDTFRQEALARQEALQEQAATVATFVLDLARDNVDRREAPAMVEEFVKMLLLNMAKKDSSIAEQMFDEQTAEGLLEVSRLESAGRYDLADARMREVREAAPGGGYCGGADCGLEAVEVGSDAGLALAKNLKAGAGDTIVKDKVRSCKCGSKTLAYAYSAVKVNKYCETCGDFESKASLATAA